MAVKPVLSLIKIEPGTSTMMDHLSRKPCPAWRCGHSSPSNRRFKKLLLALPHKAASPVSRRAQVRAQVERGPYPQVVSRQAVMNSTSEKCSKLERSSWPRKGLRVPAGRNVCPTALYLDLGCEGAL